jgi:Tfp pilus assembly protein PilV
MKAPRLPALAGTIRRQPLNRGNRGFTIAEVMIASFVMVLGISSALLTLRSGLQAVDTARNTTLAAQIMQSEIEVLRLQNWSRVVLLQDDQASPTTPKAVDPSASITTGTSTTLDATLTTIATRFACTRLITDISGRSNIKKILLTVTWTGVDGRPHELRYETRYAKNGLSDYFYTSH